MKGFDGSDLTGTKWNFSTGFKGQTGLGLIAHNDGIYNVVTANFGERITSATSQVFVTDFSSLELLPGIEGEMSWSSVPGETYSIESTPDLINWNVMETRVATGFTESFVDPDWASDVKKFYRIRW